jgi:hypothetical protein
MADNADVVGRLEKLSKKLDEAAKVNTVAIRLDILGKIIDDLNKNPELAAIFGPQVSGKLALYFDGRDMKFVDAGVVKLTPEQEKKFVEAIKPILKENLGPHLRR